MFHRARSMFTAWLVLCAALPLSAAPDAEVVPPAPGPAAVEQTICLSASPIGSGRSILMPEDLLSVLRLRLRNTAVRIELCDGGADGERRWLVRVSAPTDRGALLQIETPGGQVVLGDALMTRRRHPAEVAYTIALLVVETLAPLVPEIAAARPDEGDRPIPALRGDDKPVQLPTDEPAGTPAEDPARVRWSIAASPLGGVLGPQGRRLGAGALGGLAQGPGWLADAHLVWMSDLWMRGEGRALRLRHGDLVALGGLPWRRGAFVASLAVGPTLRFLMAETRGETVAFRRRTDLVWGGTLALSVGLELRPWDFRLVVEGSRFGTHPRYTGGEERRLNSGRELLLVGVRIAHTVR